VTQEQRNAIRARCEAVSNIKHPPQEAESGTGQKTADDPEPGIVIFKNNADCCGDKKCKHYNHDSSERFCNFGYNSKNYQQCSSYGFRAHLERQELKALLKKYGLLVDTKGR